jgi:hypothetical protein
MTVERCDVVEIDHTRFLAVAWTGDGTFLTIDFMATEPMIKVRHIPGFIDDATEIVFHPMESHSAVERCELISSMWIPPWARGASLLAQRLAGLIEAAVAGRPWAMPYVFEPGQDSMSGTFIGFRFADWARALGESEESLRRAVGEIVRLELTQPNKGWMFNT